jgi:outer membrane murein-binding lipoprotein Lpp
MPTRKHRWTLASLVGGVALAGLFGCASTAKIEDAAQREALKAQQLRAQGDYYGADKAERAAQKDREKAAARSNWSYHTPGYYSGW